MRNKFKVTAYPGIVTLVTAPFPHLHWHSDCKKGIALVGGFSHKVALRVIMEAYS